MLTSAQTAALRAEAERRGVDPGELIAAAEELSGPADQPKGKASAPAKTDRPLFMYHLPFVTVNEVRTVWLGLDPVAGGDQYAGEWASQRAASTSPDSTTE